MGPFVVVGAMQKPIEGAKSVINAAINPDLKGVGGIYYKNCKDASTSGTSR